MKSLLKKASLVTAGLVAGVTFSPPAVQAAVNYFDTTKIVHGAGSVTCPSGWKLSGGGVGKLPSNYYSSYSSDEYALTGSYPYSNVTWKASATRVHGSYSSSSGWRFSTWSYSPSVYAVCVS